MTTMLDSCNHFRWFPSRVVFRFFSRFTSEFLSKNSCRNPVSGNSLELSFGNLLSLQEFPGNLPGILSTKSLKKKSGNPPGIPCGNPREVYFGNFSGFIPIGILKGVTYGNLPGNLL